ncbi:hypothetical protein ACLB2K_059602 [Fragaria x ananassa]
MEGTVDVRAEEMEMADDGQGQGAWKKEKASRWWRGREREDGSESGSDISEKDSGWEREGVEGRGERRRVWWSRAAEERERRRVKKLMIQNGFGIALWVKLSSQYLGLIHVSTC